MASLLSGRGKKGGTLAGLFGSNSAQSSASSLSYTRPTAPSIGDEAESASPVEPPKDAILVSQAVYLYENLSGKFTSVSSTALGCIIMGKMSTYRLIIYDSSKQTKCAETVSASLSIALLADSYINVSSAGNWSIKAQNAAAAEQLVRCLFATKAHSAVHSEGDAKAILSALQPADSKLGSGHKLAARDTAGVSFSAWRISLDQTSKPTDPFNSTPATSSAPGISKLVVGDAASSPLAGLETIVEGMSKGGKRLGVVFSGQNEWLIVEVAVAKVKAFKEPAAPVPAQELAPAPATAQAPPTTSDVTARMARLAGAGRPVPMPATLGNAAALQARRRSGTDEDFVESLGTVPIGQSAQVANTDPAHMPSMQQEQNLLRQPQQVPLQQQQQPQQQYGQSDRQQQEYAPQTYQHAMVATGEVRGAYQPQHARYQVGPNQGQMGQQQPQRQLQQQNGSINGQSATHGQAYGRHAAQSSYLGEGFAPRHTAVTSDSRQLHHIEQMASNAEIILRDVAANVDFLVRNSGGAFRPSLATSYRQNSIGRRDHLDGADLVEAVSHLVDENKRLLEEREEAAARLEKTQVELRESREMTNQYLKEHQTAMMSSNKTLQDSAALRKEVEDAKATAAKRGDEIATLQQELASTKREVEETRSKLEAKNASASNSASDAAEKLVAQGSTIAELTAELGALKEEKKVSEDRAQGALAAKADELEAAAKEIETFRSQLADAEGKLEEASSTKTAAASESKIEELEAANLELLEKVAAARELGIAEGNKEMNKVVVRKTKRIMKALFAELQRRLVEAHGAEGAETSLGISREVIRDVTKAALEDVAA